MNAENLSPIANSSVDEEISLRELWEILSEQWKIMITGSFLGLLAGVGLFFFLGYTAKATINVGQTGLSFLLRDSDVKAEVKPEVISWDFLVARLVSNTDQICQATKEGGKKDDARFYCAINTDDFWRKKVKVYYAVTKTEAKDLIGKSIDSNRISRIGLEINDKTKESALLAINRLYRYFINSIEDITVSELLKRYSKIIQIEPSALRITLDGLAKEKVFLEQRIRNLENLRKQFPDRISVSQSTGVVSQSTVLDPKDSAAKFLPISMQLIAAYNDINNNREATERALGRLKELEVIKTFYDQSHAVVSGDDKNELAILIKIAEALDGKIDAQQIHEKNGIGAILNELKNIKNGLETLSDGMPTIELDRNKNANLFLLGSPVFALILMMFWVFFRRAIAKPPIKNPQNM